MVCAGNVSASENETTGAICRMYFEEKIPTEGSK